MPRRSGHQQHQDDEKKASFAKYPKRRGHAGASDEFGTTSGKKKKNSKRFP